MHGVRGGAGTMADKDTNNSNIVARNTLWMFLGEGARIAVQAAYFIIMARNLGVNQYGAFAAVSAAATLASPFVGIGVGKLMIKHVSRDRTQLPRCWGNTLVVTMAAGFVLFLLVFVASLKLLPHTIPVAAIGCILVADLIFSPLVMVAGYAFQAVEKLQWMAGLNFVATLARLVAIAAIVALHRSTLMVWAAAYLLAWVFSATFAIICTLRLLESPRWDFGLIQREFREHIYFTIGFSAQTIYNDIDKTMLAHLSTLNATGIYAAAYRLIDIAFVPVRSLLMAANPAFFRSGSGGIVGSMRFGRKLLVKPIIYSVAIGLAMLLGAPLVPYVFGHEYARTAEAVRWLSFLPLLKTLHYFVADALTSASYQGLRTLAQLVVAIFNVLLNLWVIPNWSWRGAAWSSLASDGLLAAIVAICAFTLGAKEKHALAVAMPAREEATC
jgi:O-antigen/teichoic acid export membrane protein